MRREGSWGFGVWGFGVLGLSIKGSKLWGVREVRALWVFGAKFESLHFLTTRLKNQTSSNCQKGPHMWRSEA